MSTTSNGGRKAKRTTPPITAAEALQILESAINYCRQAGLDVRAGNMQLLDGPALALAIGGARLVRDGESARLLPIAPEPLESV